MIGILLRPDADGIGDEGFSVPISAICAAPQDEKACALNPTSLAALNPFFVTNNHPSVSAIFLLLLENAIGVT